MPTIDHHGQDAPILTYLPLFACFLNRIMILRCFLIYIMIVCMILCLLICMITYLLAIYTVL